MTTYHTHHVVSVMAAKLLVLALAAGVSTITSALQAPPGMLHAPPAADVKGFDNVVIQTTNPNELERALENKGLEVADEVAASRTRSYIEVDANIDDRRLEQLSREKDSIIVGEIAPNLRYELTQIPNDVNYSQQWNLPKISAPTAWDSSTGSSSTTIAVVDTGVLSSQTWETSGPYDNPDMPASKVWNNDNELGATTLEGSAPNCTSRGLALDRSCNNRDDDNNGFIDDWHGWDFMGGWRGSSGGCPNYTDPDTYADPDFPTFITEDNDPQPYSCDDYFDPDQLNKDHYDNACGYGWGACVLGHGTAVSSVAASASNNTALIAGVDWNARIMPVRALDGYGYGNSSQIAAAIDYATANGADVINLSIAMSIDDDCAITDTLVDGALARAETAGVVVVAASGNEGSGEVCYPARSPKTIAVGASDSNDARASFSSYGPELDLVAPGAAVPTTNAPSKAEPSNYDSSAYGTSFAAPHVAGAAALMKSLHPEASASEIRNELRYSADKVAGMGGQPFTTAYGYGRLNLSRTITMNSIPSYTTLSDPREMWLIKNLTKTNLSTMSPIGPTIEESRVIRFETKAYINGQWYLRSAHDTDRGYHSGIPLKYLRNVPSYRPLDKPRSMRLAINLRKTNLLNKDAASSTLLRGRVIRFETKAHLKNGVWYLRTAYDTKYDLHFGIPLAQLTEV